MDHPWQQLLFYLYNDGRAWMGALPSNDWRRVLVGAHGAVKQLNLQVMTDSWQVQKHIRGTSNSADMGARKGFVLPPCKHAEASLTVLVPFILENGEIPRLSLQLGVLNESKFFGYRFESPEIHEEHKFHHAQPVQSFGHGLPLDMSATWYPSRYPSFPLSEGAELVAALLVSIREWARLIELTTSNNLPREAKHVVAQFLQKVRPSV